MTRSRMVVFLTGLAALAGGCSQRHAEQGLAPGPAPDFSLSDLNGTKVTLSAYREQVVLLAFWAIKCGPCRAESPHLKALHDKYAHKGLRILAVNAWDEPVEDIRRFAADNRLTYTILPGGRQVFRESYRGRQIPQVYLIDKRGNVIWSHLGFASGDEKEMERRIVEAVNTPM